MIYTTSQDLIDVLTKNGFIEMTKKRYPEHYQRLINSNYNADGMKRAFGRNKKIQIIFDYINIVTLDYGNELFKHKSSLTVDEVKSMIAFFKLPSQFRLAIKREHKPITDLYVDYNYYKTNFNIKSTSLGRSIIKAYEEVITD